MYGGGPQRLGRYRLLAELGRGGMADVFLTSSEGPGGGQVLQVVKRLRKLDDPQHMTMFLDEARIARRLSHPNIVRTFEIGQDAGAHFIAMEYLHGPTLQRLRSAAALRGRRVPWAVEIAILANVLDGLHYAHELCGLDGGPLHVVHRDLSPENVMVTQSGDCKILDFGIAKAIDSLTQTQSGFIKGKLKNMPPEQVHGQRVDRRADLYAVGVMLWEGLTARPLWGGLGNAAIAARLAQGNLPPLRDPAIPEDLRQICLRALEASPERRYGTAIELRADLLDWAERNQLCIGRAELADFVEPLFSEERERIERVVQSLLHTGNPSLRQTGPVPLPPAEAFSAMERTPAPRQRPADAGPTELLDSRSSEPSGRRWTPVLAVGTAVGLGLSIFAISLETGPPVTAPFNPPAATSPSLPAARLSPPPSPPEAAGAEAAGKPSSSGARPAEPAVARSSDRGLHPGQRKVRRAGPSSSKGATRNRSGRNRPVPRR